MKIGILCYPTYGGSGVVATELGHAMARVGHEVHFISYAPPFRMQERLTNVFYHEVATMSYPVFKEPPYTLAAAAKVVEVMEVAGLDVLHAHYAVPHSIVAFLAQQMYRYCVPYVTTLHGTDITLVGVDPSFAPMTRPS